MDKKSLIEARELLIITLSNSEIDIADKLELMININHFLDNEKYEENIKTLSKK